MVQDLVRLMIGFLNIPNTWQASMASLIEDLKPDKLLIDENGQVASESSVLDGSVNVMVENVPWGFTIAVFPWFNMFYRYISRYIIPTTGIHWVLQEYDSVKLDSNPTKKFFWLLGLNLVASLMFIIFPWSCISCLSSIPPTLVVMSATVFLHRLCTAHMSKVQLCQTWSNIKQYEALHVSSKLDTHLFINPLPSIVLVLLSSCIASAISSSYIN